MSYADIIVSGMLIPYSQKIWRFGGSASQPAAKLKFANITLRTLLFVGTKFSEISNLPNFH